MNRDFELRRLYARYGGSMADDAAAIERELARESDKRRRIVELTLQGLSQGDIGRRMGGVTTGAIRSRLALTMTAIRKRVEGQHTTGGYVLGAHENRHPDDVRAEAQRLAAAGVARSEICAKLGVSKASLSRWLRL